jgi:hypothetical protein
MAAEDLLSPGQHPGIEVPAKPGPAHTVGELTNRGWKLRKLNKRRRMDATVAACLAHTRAQHHRPKPKANIYWMEQPTA